MISVMKMLEKDIRLTKRDSNMKRYLQNRLKTIDGQIKGISRMVEDDRYCGDILIQISAVSKSLKSLGSTILKNHLSGCVAQDIQNNNTKSIDEVIDLIRRLDL